MGHVLVGQRLQQAAIQFFIHHEMTHATRGQQADAQVVREGLDALAHGRTQTDATPG